MSTTRTRSERLEVRTTKDERSLIDRAVAEQGTDLTEFVVSNLTVAARRVLPQPFMPPARAFVPASSPNASEARSWIPWQSRISSR